MRVLAAMSGGVDSAVAAARAVDAGHEVTGVHLALSLAPEARRSGARGCCTVEDANDARRAADRLGIPFYVWDLAERFARDVVADFVEEYAAGRTPNPCVRCNERIKFAAVLDRARALDFDAVCTGHHARLVDGALFRSVDRAKDQSYVLASLTAAQLAGALFPLGDTTKPQVRREAARRGLAVADKPDSHDVCFVPTGDTPSFLSKQLGAAAGDIVEAATGKLLGQHAGAFRYTVGQRRGLGLQRAGPDGARRYVLRVLPECNTVLVGPRERLAVRSIRAGSPVWHRPRPAGPLRCEAQLRAHGEPLPATARQLGDQVCVEFDEPAFGVAAGQTVALYRGDRVVAGGTIVATG